MRRAASRWLVGAAAALALCGQAYADELTAEKRADIRQLISGSAGARLPAQMAETAGRAITMALRRSRPDIPERVLTAIQGDLDKFFQERLDSPGGLVERMIAVYHTHFTHPEIRELIAFSETPIGRKTFQVLPMIMSDTVAAGQAWGRSLGPEVQQRIDAALKREGIAPSRRK